jgi:hypothetical protein
VEPRSVLKFLRKFALRELKEKRADRVYVRRVKMEPLMMRGWLPDTIVRRVKGVRYLVCVFRGDTMRVYYMGRSGISLGASEFTGAERDRMWKEILERTRNVFSAPE